MYRNLPFCSQLYRTGILWLVTLWLWALSSVGRAPALQAGGREFESLYLHQIMVCSLTLDQCKGEVSMGKSHVSDGTGRPYVVTFESTRKLILEGTHD